MGEGIGRNAHDIAVELVTKLDTASLKTEEGIVTTRLLRGLAGNREFENSTSRDFLRDCNNLGLDIIARSLDELGASRPGGLSIVAHPPGLAEVVIAEDLVLVGEAFLDEASRVARLLLGNRLAVPTMVVRVDREVLARNQVSHCPGVRLIPTLGKVLTDQFVGGLLWLADLKKRVLLSHSNAVIDTLLTEVSVSAD